ncbi:MAG TPA: hypothetical protein VMZ33_02375 [Candidatus Limnocylindrales bacterium]|nr:hypothetical protein [Candidatus Limnocylindrales bacterium]
MPPDLERLANYARSRGFRRYVAITLLVIGCVPALLIVLLRPPVGQGTILVAALLIFTPAALLLLWTVRDGEGQAAREVVMWLRVIDRAVTSAPWLVPYKELPAVPDDSELPRVRMGDLAVDLRETISPLVASGGLTFRILVQRFWYPLQALALGLLLAVALTVVLPNFSRSG